MDRTRKDVIEIFKQEGLKVTTECNASCVDFLDVVLDLKNDITKPFIKPNANTKYVSVSQAILNPS